MIVKAVFCALLVAALQTSAATRQPLPHQPAPGLADTAELLPAGDVQLQGWLGERVLSNEKSRLATVDVEPFLVGFRHKPGTHPWIGEHIGKWMHAATLAWAYTGELIKAQEADGFSAEQ